MRRRPYLFCRPAALPPRPVDQRTLRLEKGFSVCFSLRHLPPPSCSWAHQPQIDRPSQQHLQGKQGRGREEGRKGGQRPTQQFFSPLPVQLCIFRECSCYTNLPKMTSWPPTPTPTPTPTQPSCPRIKRREGRRGKRYFLFPHNSCFFYRLAREERRERSKKKNNSNSREK